MKRRRSRTRRSSRRAGPRKLTLREQAARNSAFETLALMRTKRLSLAKAAKEAGEDGVSVRSVLRHVGPALVKGSNGRYAAKPSDRLVRSLRFLTEEGQIVLDVRGSRKASQIGEYFTAVENYLAKGEDEALRKFEGKSIRIGKTVYPFITDKGTLERLGYAGQVQFEDLYAMSR
jgi:hypothetical protein